MIAVIEIGENLSSLIVALAVIVFAAAIFRPARSGGSSVNPNPRPDGPPPVSQIRPVRSIGNNGPAPLDRRPPAPPPAPRNVTLNEVTLRHSRCCTCDTCRKG